MAIPLNQPAFKNWLIAVFIIVVLSLTSYGAVQQDLRQTANDPQIQYVEDVTALIAQGANPTDIIGANSQTNLATSLAPFLMILDKDGKVLASSAVLDGTPPTPAISMLTYAKDHNAENRVTWQPKSGVRIAAVIGYQKDKQDYVLAGRSLTEVEKRETSVGEIVLGGGLIAIVGVSLILLQPKLKLKKRTRKNEEEIA